MFARRGRALVGALLAMALAATLGSCTRPGWPGTRPTTTTSSGSPTAHGRYAQQVFTSVDKVATGVTYKPADPVAGWPSDLKFDAWAPAGDTAEKRPAIVWGFGGAFVAGDRSQMANYAQDSARRGYVGITIDYRLLQGGTDINHGIIPAYLDTIAAGEWLKANAARYRIDPDAIVVGGFSAGAMNAINSIVLPGAPLPPLPSGWVPAGTVNPDSTPYVAAISNSGSAVGPMANPPQHVSRPGQRPIIMFGGTADNVVSYKKWQQTTCQDHTAAGNECELVTYRNLGHGVFAQLPDLLNRSAAFVKQQVLIPKGYPADQ
jgi:acetyl esterase/lipase